MTIEEYYQAPSDEIFNEIKEKAIEIWSTYDDTYGYATKKIENIRDVQNIQDNAWYIVSMFDPINQQQLIRKVKPETATLIRSALSSS